MTHSEVPEGAVIVGVENWPVAADAVSWAAEQALRDGRDLCLVHVVATDPLETPPGFRAGSPSEPEQAHGAVVLSSARRYAERRLEELSVAFIGHRPPEVTTDMRAGSVARELVIASRHASLLVLASRGRGWIGSRVLGSVTRSVLGDAWCPVVVLCPGAGGVGRGVLVGIDGTGDSIPALEFAFDQAAQRRLPVTVLYCDPGGAHSGSDDRLLVAECVAGLQERYPDVYPRLRVEEGKAADVLADQARTMHMVVIGGNGGAVAHRLLDHAHCVVTVVPPTAPGADVPSWSATRSGAEDGW